LELRIEGLSTFVLGMGQAFYGCSYDSPMYHRTWGINELDFTTLGPCDTHQLEINLSILVFFFAAAYGLSTTSLP
jgi:hypothetical protein